MKKTWLFKLALAGGSILVTLLAVEILYSVYAGFFRPVNFSLTAYSRPVAKFDPVRGYRLSPGETRVVRVEQGHVIYDSIFRVNNMGWTSARDYSHAKPDDTYRILVFGDSFTSGEIHSAPWPDLLHESLQSTSADGKKFEVHSISFDGGGLANWHSVFFGEVVPNFEFDAIIIASYVDNLSRWMSVYEMDDRRALFGRFDRIPETEEGFRSACLPLMEPVASVVDSAEIDRSLNKGEHWRWPGFGLATRNAIEACSDLYRMSRYRQKIDSRQIEDPGTLADRNALETLYAPVGGLGKLWAILDHAAENDIDVMIATIPDRRLAKEDALTKGKALNFHHIELASIANLYGAAYFNGYEVFRPYTPEDIEEEFWFKFDAHWNNEGTRLFASKIAEFILETWPREESK